MAWTFDTISTAIGDWLGIPSTDTRRLPAATRALIINARHREIARRIRFRGLEASATPLTIVAGTYSYTLPTDWSTPVGAPRLKNTTTSELSELTIVDLDQFDELYPDPTDTTQWGTPDHCAFEEGNLLIGPTPNAALGTILLRYNKVPADLSASNETSPITASMGEALMFYATADACAYVFEEARAPFFENRADQIFQQVGSIESRQRYEGQRPVSEDA